MRESQPLLYILAPSYSGSTLLTYLLGLHPGIATIGELKATSMGNVSDYVCSCGERIVVCPFWSQVSAESRGQGLAFDVRTFDTVLGTDAGGLTGRILRADVRGPLFEQLRRIALSVYSPARQRLVERLSRNDTLIEIITRLQKGKVFLDGSKDSTRLLHFQNSKRWSVRVIYLNRDGRAVSASIAKHTGMTYDRAGMVWARNQRGLQNMRRRLGKKQVFDLRYEDFCEDPKATLSKIFAWLELDDIDIETTDFKQRESHILGNAMRLTSFSKIRLDEGWRQRLSSTELNAFDRDHGRLNTALGYR